MNCFLVGEDVDESINYKSLIEKYHQSQVTSKKMSSKTSSSINKGVSSSSTSRGTSGHSYFSVGSFCPLNSL